MKNRANKIYQCIFHSTGSSSSIKLLLRRSVQLHLFMAALPLMLICLTSCEKNIDLKIDNYTPLLVVEAYINNQIPEYNYVVLSRSLEYFSTDFQSIGVSNANVTITEGELKDNRYVWNQTKKVQLTEATFPNTPENFKKGVYFDPRLSSNPQNALIGTPGKSYLLEISEGGHQYSAIATMLTPVPIDSLTAGYKYVDESDSNKTKLRITNHYKDPDTLNNTQFYYFRYSENRKNFGEIIIEKTFISAV